MYCESNVEDDTCWVAFHAKNEKYMELFPSINALFPLFHDSSMIHHQVPVLCADQSLYTLEKIVQWNSQNILERINLSYFLFHFLLSRISFELWDNFWQVVDG